MRASSFACVTALVALSFLVGSTSAKPDQHGTLAATDTAAIRTLLERYRLGWLANNGEEVRSVFTNDAVLLPHHGVAPVVGMSAIRDFWWPISTTKTTIVKFVLSVDEIGGDDALAYLRGRSEVAWSVEDQGKVQHWHNSGNFMTILRKQPHGNGSYRISFGMIPLIS